MKGFLLDENLPRRLSFSPTLPMIHATELGVSPTDSALWEYARHNLLTIVTKDADFSDRIMLGTAPPWIVQLKLGNLRLAEFDATLGRLWPQIERLLPEHKLLSVFADRIETVRD